MYYYITEISSESTMEALTYICVEFWLSKADADIGRPPLLINDFRLDLRNARHGRAVDVAKEIRRHILAYWRRAKRRNATGDETGYRIKRDTRDPHSILARQDVKDLCNSGLIVDGE